MSHKFTVVLREPESVRAITDPCDSYTALVIVDLHNCTTAVAAARDEYAKVILREHKLRMRPKDIDVLVVFEGHQQPVLFGWQTGVNS